MYRFLIAAFALAACAQTPLPAPTTTPEAATPGALEYLAGTRWAMVDESVRTRTPTIEFNATGAAGFAGCNRWFGGVEAGDSRLRFDSVGSTKMACPEQEMAVEQNFLSILERTRDIHYDADALVLLDASDAVIATFASAE